jgi:hypothetical protein
VNTSSQQSNKSNAQKSNLSVERVILFVGLLGFLTFIWMLAFFFVPMLQHRSRPNPLFGPVVEVTATPDFRLPPTWTPGPTEELIPTLAGTQVVSGDVPTRIYTPRPTSLPGLPLPIVPRSISVIDLARIMQGESPGDKEAAYMVGWVAKNRLLHPSYGETYLDVSGGFFGYLAGINPNNEFMDIARRVIRSRDDPTGGSLYALSRTDITKLGVPPGRADVAYGEWFFFRTWPLNAR